MPDIYGTWMTRRDVEARTGQLAQFAGVRLMTLDDGLERGIRMLEQLVHRSAVFGIERRADGAGHFVFLIPAAPERFQYAARLRLQLRPVADIL